MPDSLSDRYAELLTGSYAWVDRIVLNAYLRMGHDPGGFPFWWRALTGSEETQDNTRLCARRAASAVAFAGMRKRRAFRLCIVQPRSASMSSWKNSWKRRRLRKACF